MPKKNVNKPLLENTFYHIFNKALGKRALFKDTDDYEAFKNILNRYLSGDKFTDKYERQYKIYRGDADIISYCLTPKNFHLLLYQHEDKTAMPSLMRSLANAYTSYYNKKYRKIGPILDGTYRASQIDNPEYLIHVSRHIILQADKYNRWPHNSLTDYLGQSKHNWLDAKLMQETLEKNPGAYLAFLADKEGYINSLKYISGILADR